MKQASEYFRASVGAVVVNEAGLVLAGRRADIDEAVWQFPQGGIAQGEDPKRAIYRELAEELGITADDLSPLENVAEWLTYELPEAYRSDKTGRGQTQQWFLFRFTGRDSDIVADGQEFSDWRWMNIHDVIRMTASFRRPVYEVLSNKFRRYLA